MNDFTKTLLGGAALWALTTAPATAGNAPAFHITALHGGRVVNKTKMPNHGATHITYTFGAYSYVSSSSLNKSVTLPATFLKFSSCTFDRPPVKVRAPKKSEYAKIGWTTETYSNVCVPGPTVFYGNTYKLTDPNAKGKTDHFVSTQIFRVKRDGTKYKETVNLDVSVTIE